MAFTTRTTLMSAGLVSLLISTGCATAPNIGDSSAKTVATGSAGGQNANNANSQLEHCPKSLGTVTLVEDTNADWWTHFQGTKLRSTIPVLRLLVQQSNCFVVIERGVAMRNMMQERALEQSGEMRDNSNFQKGQMVAADYTMKPDITFSDRTGGLGSKIGGFLGGSLGAAIGGSVKFNEASTMLTLIDNRSGVQLAAAEGSSKNMDIGLMGSLFGSRAGASAEGYSKTPEGKVLTAAFMDSYNQMVRSLREYKAQSVEGGLGTGGTLGVDGGSTPASKKLKR